MPDPLEPVSADHDLGKLPSAKPPRKLAVAASLLSLAWVIGATMFYRSGGLSFAGLLPTVGCLISVWGAIKADPTVMWLGTGVVAASAALFIFSLGFVVIPAVLILALASILVSRADR